MTKGKLYTLLSLLCLAGYAWVAFSFFGHSHASVSVCFFKNVSGLPCPSCGSTRALLALLQGDVAASLACNPVGILLFFFLLFAPFWLLYDGVKKSDTLFTQYQYAERVIRKKIIALPLVAMMLGNWIWTIYKGL